jgi:methyltransferase (TIGR00027 family)
VSPRLIEDVADTARWVAYLRALESDRPDALFRDRFARRLAGERGKRIAEGMPPLPHTRPGPGALAGNLAVRTWIFDAFILESIARLDAGAVLNLAAGLDARPYRLKLPPHLTWIEADRAAILDEKAAVLATETPACKVERAPVDLADATARRALFDRVAAEHARVVVVTEGLLVYLDEPQVAALADDLRARPSIRRWVLEMLSPEILQQQMSAWRPVLAPANAEWKFAPPDGYAFLERRGWTIGERRAVIPEAKRLGRFDVPHRWAIDLLTRLSRRFRARLESAVVYGIAEPG